MTDPTAGVEQVVLLDEDGNAVGTAPKASVHTEDTPLHLAFSCYVVDGSGRVLLTRRSDRKLTWPGVWTNSCCGHPLPGEDLEVAVRRRLLAELGVTAGAVDLVLPTFRYRAVMPSGIVEYEMCPVLRARYEGGLDPDPDEVSDTAWVAWQGFADDVLADRRPVSPWCLSQVGELAPLGTDPLAWPRADSGELPPAARQDGGAAGAR